MAPNSRLRLRVQGRPVAPPTTPARVPSGRRGGGRGRVGRPARGRAAGSQAARRAVRGTGPGSGGAASRRVGSGVQAASPAGATGPRVSAGRPPTAGGPGCAGRRRWRRRPRGRPARARRPSTWRGPRGVAEDQLGPVAQLATSRRPSASSLLDPARSGARRRAGHGRAQRGASVRRSRRRPRSTLDRRQSALDGQPRRIVPSPATGSGAVARGRHRGGWCSITWMRRPCGKSGGHLELAHHRVGGTAWSRALVDVQGGHRRRRLEGARTRSASSVVSPVTVTSSTATSDESRSQNW